MKAPMHKVRGVVEGGVYRHLKDGWTRACDVAMLDCGHAVLVDPRSKPVRRRCFDCPRVEDGE